MIISPVKWTEEGLEIIDQTALPAELARKTCKTAEEVAQSIKKLEVRGAPAIGIAAAYGLVLRMRQCEECELGEYLQILRKVSELLRSTRPTAVNLFWALDRMERAAIKHADRPTPRITDYLLKEAMAIHREDVEMNVRMGVFGADLLPDGSSVLTHCNAGALATGGHGTALGVIRSAIAQKKKIRVWVDETRPVLQGSRITAWELMQDDIPCALICDNMAGFLMQQGKVDVVITGADRIAANGDVANKIGTYSIASLARMHGIPFYVAAPTSTIDVTTASKDQIIIESRNAEEMKLFNGKQIAPKDVEVYNPSFDLTPHQFVTAIITDKGVIHPPFKTNIEKIFGSPSDKEEQ